MEYHIRSSSSNLQLNFIIVRWPISRASGLGLVRYYNVNNFKLRINLFLLHLHVSQMKGSIFHASYLSVFRVKRFRSMQYFQNQSQVAPRQSFSSYLIPHLSTKKPVQLYFELATDILVFPLVPLSVGFGHPRDQLFRLLLGTVNSSTSLSFTYQFTGLGLFSMPAILAPN